MQVLEGWQVASDYLLSTADDALESVYVLGCGSGIPDGDGGGEDGLNDGGVEVHHRGLWHFEFLQLPHKVHPLLRLFGESSDVQLPF